MTPTDESWMVTEERRAEYEAKVEPPTSELKARAEEHGFDEHDPEAYR